MCLVCIYTDTYVKFTGVVRACIAHEKDNCTFDTKFEIPYMEVFNGTGDFCMCTGARCNSAAIPSKAQTTPGGAGDYGDYGTSKGAEDYVTSGDAGGNGNSALQTSVGHLAISFIVTSGLLALAAARLVTG